MYFVLDVFDAIFVIQSNNKQVKPLKHTIMKAIIIAAVLYSAVIWVFWTVIRRWIYRSQVAPKDLKAGQIFTFYEHTDGNTKPRKARVVVNIKESECVYATPKGSDKTIRIEYNNISNLV